MGKAVHVLGEEYQLFYTLDLQKDLLAVLIAVLLVVPMHFLVPITTLFDMEKGLGAYGIRFLCLMVFSVLYIVLHELVHGAAMKLCGTKKVKFGFTGLYAFAGSDDYYDKRAYLFIALAPVVLWGLVLAVVNLFVPESWFWVVYLIQITNLSGAAGDLLVTVKFSRFPRDILITDCGVGMKVYQKQDAKIS